MNSRDRIIRTIDRKMTDRVPYSFDITSHIKKRLLEYYSCGDDLHRYIGDDLLYIGYNLPHELLDDGLYRDEFGIVWNNSKNDGIGDVGEIAVYPLPKASLKGYRFPEGDDPRRFQLLDETALKTQGRFVVAALTGLFDICWFLRGFENFMMDMAGDAPFAKRLLDKALAYNLGVIAKMPDCVDGVRFGEDWGLQKGLMFGGALWRRLLKPRLKIMYEAARKKGFRVFIHSCGDITELFPDLIGLGVQVINPVQPEAMDLAMLKREYGKDVVLYGGLGSQSTIVYGAPTDVMTEVENRLTLFADGGYILGPAGALPTDAKLENVITLVDFVMGINASTKK